MIVSSTVRELFDGVFSIDVRRSQYPNFVLIRSFVLSPRTFHHTLISLLFFVAGNLPSYSDAVLSLQFLQRKMPQLSTARSTPAEMHIKVPYNRSSVGTTPDNRLSSCPSSLAFSMKRDGLGEEIRVIVDGVIRFKNALSFRDAHGSKRLEVHSVFTILRSHLRGASFSQASTSL